MGSLIGLAFGELILRGELSKFDYELMEYLSQEDKSTAYKWLAIARAYQKHKEAVQACLAYWVSHSSKKKDKVKRALLIKKIDEGEIGLHNLTFEMLYETNLGWKDIKKLVGYSINPTRIRRSIIKEYEELNQTEPCYENHAIYTLASEL